MAEYAWVMLLMRGDAYLRGALVLCNSLLETNTKADIVVMVTRDVSIQAIEALRRMSDKIKVKPINYIRGEFKARMSRKQQDKYGRWMNDIPTKFNAVNLTEYRKVVLLDTDIVVVRNSDELFDLPAPAGLWEFFQTGINKTTGELLYTSKTMKDMAELKHGQHVPTRIVDDALNNSFVCWGTSMVLEPNTSDFNNLVRLTNEGFHMKNCKSGFEEQIFAYYYRDRWTKVGLEYGLVPWKFLKMKTEDAKILHFFGDKKPWDYKPNEQVWPDIVIWRKYEAMYMNKFE